MELIQQKKSQSAVTVRWVSHQIWEECLSGASFVRCDEENKADECQLLTFQQNRLRQDNSLRQKESVLLTFGRRYQRRSLRVPPLWTNREDQSRYICRSCSGETVISLLTVLVPRIWWSRCCQYQVSEAVAGSNDSTTTRPGRYTEVNPESAITPTTHAWPPRQQ